MVTDWSVKNMAEEARKETSEDWHYAVAGQPRMREESSREEIEKESESIESTLMEIVDKHANVIKVTACCKR